MTIKPYLQLVRLPNVFTAAADSLVGWLIVMGSFEDPETWFPLLGASMAIYAAGMVLNDLFDIEVDRRERPSRPLPSGRVSRRFAAALGVVLLSMGFGLAVESGSHASALVAGVLIASVVAYDGGVKRTILGPALMGACRGLNVLLGMSHAPSLGGPAAWCIAGSMAMFVIGITWISRSETETGRTRGTIAGWCLQNLGLLGLAISAVMQAGGSSDSTSSSPGWWLVLGIMILLTVAIPVNRANRAAVLDAVPPRLQHAVKTGVLSLVWLNVGVVAIVRGPLPALAVAVLWIPAYAIGKWIYST